MRAIDIIVQTRAAIARGVETASLDELLWIPPGFRNNILWNLGHVVVTQQMLHYARAGQETYLSDELVAQFRKGSSPADWDRVSDPDLVLRLLRELPTRLDEDYHAGRLSNYQPYTTGGGIHLPDIETAIVFNGFHEGIHFGTILSYRRMWSAETT